MTRAERRGENRAALVDAALAEMGARGYRAARLEDIAERAGLTTGAVYSIFGSKRSLLVAAVERLTQRLRDGLAVVLDDEELTLGEALRAFGRVLHGLAGDERAPQWFAFELEAAVVGLRDAELGRTLDAHAEEVAELLRQVFAGRVLAGGGRSTDEDAARLAPAAHALAAGLAQRVVREPGALGAEYVADAVGALEGLVG
ncbi:TetR/AcrR family transcriptional regulator [Streptomyces flavofungini]|uniref:TetR/AcrR family transcriptional regulator n=1 Tax=Streptomyces flavofungini TaxID=68200 RepID=A0ABS0X1E1_9ACTN|nr:TetR/AcrR family transcriptional regulator [Streptomyces flavofungini]MBJ3806998.1 TetR/AcrR family transcriptional regulator [Streptomyces flavofungini]